MTMQGTIKRLTDKNFGFIGRENEEKDLFFHGNDLVNTTFDQLHEGDAVSFEVETTSRGQAAVKVSKA